MAAMIVFTLVLIGICNSALGTMVVPGPADNDYTTSPEGKLYKLHLEPLAWGQAEDACVVEGGHLAVVTSESESAYLTKLMLAGLSAMDSPSPSALLGFSRDSNRQFTTIDGKPLGSTGFQRWSSAGPEFLGLKGGNCGALHRDGGLSRFPCQTAAPFLCEKHNDTTQVSTTTSTTTTTPEPTTTTELPKPADGYELLPGLGWYKIHGNNKKWHDAVVACEAEGTHLAVLNSEAEANALKRMMQRQRGVNYGPCHCALIGFHDLSMEGHFITVFGEPLESTGFTKWGPGNPDNSGNNEDCGSITYRGDLNDLSCLQEYPFICEHSTNSRSYNQTVNKNAIQSQAGYEIFTGVGSYKLHSNGKRWSDALEECQKENAYLAVINSDAEADVIRKILGRNPDLEIAQNRAVYIGFKDVLVKGNYTTIFGEPVESSGFTKWAQNRPGKPDTSSNCGGFDRNGRLDTINCFLLNPFVCEKVREGERERVAYLVDKPEAAQVSAYEMHAGMGYYKLSVDKATWYEAKKKCEEEDAHLAIINSNKESELLKKIVSQSTNVKLQSSIFLGFHDQTNEGNFETIFGTPLESTGFDKWAAWNPDNFGRGEDCGAMNHEGYLNDVPCDIKLHYFCERTVNSSNSRNAFEAQNRMKITPDHIHVRERSHVTVLCESKEPLIECNFKLMNGQVIDLSLGPATKNTYSQMNRDITIYQYTGTGLANGQCGMNFTVSPGLHRTMVGCRGRSLHGEWQYAYMSLQASNAPPLMDLKPPPSDYLIQNTSEPLRLVWQSKNQITSCKCIMPTQSMETHLLDPTSDQQFSISSESYEDDFEFFEGIRPSWKSENAVRYHGLGFKAGQCGIEIADPKIWNGYLWCGMGTDDGWDWRSVAIIVAKPPSEPELTVHAAEHSEGAILEAECTVRGSRPMANVTWYLGEDVIRQDAKDDSPSSTWSWPFDEQTITQKISRQLRAGDRGKELVCEAGHPMLPSGIIRTSKVINIEGVLINQTFDIEEYGFEAGKTGFITVVITASPEPEITWHFDNVTIKAGSQDATGRFIAAKPTKLNLLSILWEAKLFITTVTEEDFSRDFHVTAKNDMGAQAYKVVMVRGRPTIAPPLEQRTTISPTPITARTTTRWTTKAAWTPTTQGLVTTMTTSAAMEITTTEFTDYNQETTVGVPDVSTEPPNFKLVKIPLIEMRREDEKTSWATSGAIAGIVIAILIVHLSLAAVMVYGRRSGWWCLPRKAQRRFLPSMSMDNLMDEENRQ